jgi:hypothetical protein
MVIGYVGVIGSVGGRYYRVRGRCRVCSTVIEYRRWWMGVLNV